MEHVSTISDHIRMLSSRIAQEITRLSEDANNGISHRTDSLIYVGNWQDAIPRSIWLDQSLSATDVRCWGVIRTQAVQGSSVLLSLNRLLADTLGYSNATISRVIYVLRLTRWISLCSQLRSESGQFQGHIYAIHDQPLNLSDAIYLDENYIDFVKKQMAHSNKQINELAKTAWQSIGDFVHANEAPLPQNTNSGVFGFLNTMSLPADNTASRFQKLNTDDHVYFLNMAENSHVQFLNAVENDPIQKLNVVEKNSENEENQSLNIHVQKLNAANVCSSLYNKTTTTTTTGKETENFENQVEVKKHPESDGLIFPSDFNANEVELAGMYLNRVETELWQAFLDETAGQIIQRRKTSNPIRNPIGFLSWLCNEHAQGNTYLTSAHLKHRERREQQQAVEKSVKAKQDVLVDAAKQGDDGTKTREILVEKSQHRTSKADVSAPTSRWDGLNRSVRPK